MELWIQSSYNNKAICFFDLGESSSYFKNLAIAITYRSNVHWDIKGMLLANSYVYQGTGITKVEGFIRMDVDLVLATLPPILNVGVSNDFGNHRLEFVYERTFWGSAKIFEFGYSNQVFNKSNLKGLGASFVNPEQMLGAADYSAVAYGNGWKDSNSYRLGYTYSKKSHKLMGSIAYDETPAPQGEFGIPDANA